MHPTGVPVDEFWPGCLTSSDGRTRTGCAP